MILCDFYSKFKRRYPKHNFIMYCDVAELVPKFNDRLELVNIRYANGKYMPKADTVDMANEWGLDVADSLLIGW